MTNFEIYRKTLPFALWRILLSLAGLLLALGLPVGAFLLTQNGGERTCAIATGVALVVGLVLCWLLARYASYLLKAGQIAMIAKGVDGEELPERIVTAGREAVRGRFLSANVYFALESLTRGATSQITKGLTGAATALGSLGGQDGASIAGGIGATISAFVSIILEYVNYCCLGWVFHCGAQNAFKSTCDGAVVYFQNWKTMLKNAGKVFGLTLASLVLLGGPLVWLLHSLLCAWPGITSLLAAVAEAAELDLDVTQWTVAAIGGLCVWGVVNSALVKPYVLVSVMRSFFQSAEQNPPKLDVCEKLCKLSSSFRKAFAKSGETVEA